MRSEGLILHIRHPNPWDLHWREKPAKHLALETNRTYIEETQKAVENCWSTLKGDVPRLTRSRTQDKSSSLKSAYAIDERDLFANFQASVRDARVWEDFLCRKRPRWVPFLYSLYLVRGT